jgi:hypothetical protein
MVVHKFTGPRLSGTCDGACDHYVACKPGHPAADRVRCRRECPDVFSDRDNLMTFEALSCVDAVEYIDGTGNGGPVIGGTSPGSPARPR